MYLDGPQIQPLIVAVASVGMELFQGQKIVEISGQLFKQEGKMNFFIFIFQKQCSRSQYFIQKV